MWDELLDDRRLASFRESFTEYLIANIESGISIDDYVHSGEFKELNAQVSGLGPAYLGLVVQRLLAAEKIKYENGKYVNGPDGGLNSSRDEVLTPEQKKDFVRLLDSGFMPGEDGRDL
ncbi:hypothetical protein KY329_04910 [Candidatus Woesearchaeota archaeon]|nr:hypothetical protein [Candidatus Woesearchaeota archaeon]